MKPKIGIVLFMTTDVDIEDFWILADTKKQERIFTCIAENMKRRVAEAKGKQNGQKTK